jgi:ABC-2 type transport system permease protein/oleandomycin transport system permease protein
MAPEVAAERFGDPAHARSARRGGSIVRDTWVVTRRNLRTLLRQPQLLVFATVQPVLLVLLFNYVFGNALEGVLPGDVDYIDFFIPGIVIQVVAFGTQQTAVGMAQDLSTGIVDRFRSLPMARSAVLGGRVLADAVRVAWTALLIAGVGALLGWRFSDGLLSALLAFVLVVAFGLAMSWITAWIGMSVRNPEAAQSAGIVWIFPLTFASSAFVAIETFPGWLEAFARVNPITVFVDTTRALLLDGSAYELTASLVWRSLAWLVAILAVFAPLAVAQYRRST